MRLRNSKTVELCHCATQYVLFSITQRSFHSLTWQTSLIGRCLDFSSICQAAQKIIEKADI